MWWLCLNLILGFAVFGGGVRWRLVVMGWWLYILRGKKGVRREKIFFFILGKKQSIELDVYA